MVEVYDDLGNNKKSGHHQKTISFTLKEYMWRQKWLVISNMEFKILYLAIFYFIWNFYPFKYIIDELINITYLPLQS